VKANILRDNNGVPIVMVESVLIADCDLPRVDAETESRAISYYLTLAQDYELVFRIYRTPQGLRVICVSDFIKPKAPVAKRILEDLGSDPRYDKSAINIGSFVARLGGKAARMGLQVPPKFGYYALLPKEQRAWDAVYNAAAANYRACEFILQTSECEMPSEIANFIALHDERTKCFSDLPMA
jgi:hypothetical protein